MIPMNPNLTVEDIVSIQQLLTEANNYLYKAVVKMAAAQVSWQLVNNLIESGQRMQIISNELMGEAERPSLAEQMASHKMMSGAVRYFGKNSPPSFRQASMAVYSDAQTESTKMISEEIKKFVREHENNQITKTQNFLQAEPTPHDES